MDIVEELLDLGGSMQQCKVHQKAAAEIELLRKQKQAVIEMFKENLQWHINITNELFYKEVNQMLEDVK